MRYIQVELLYLHGELKFLSLCSDLLYHFVSRNLFCSTLVQLFLLSFVYYLPGLPFSIISTFSGPYALGISLINCLQLNSVSSPLNLIISTFLTSKFSLFAFSVVIDIFDVFVLSCTLILFVHFSCIFPSFLFFVCFLSGEGFFFFFLFTCLKFITYIHSFGGYP